MKLNISDLVGYREKPYPVDLYIYPLLKSNTILSSSGPGPRSDPGQVSGLLQVRSIRSKDKDQRPEPGLYIKSGLTL